jgi:hypothetical protein
MKYTKQLSEYLAKLAAVRNSSVSKARKLEIEKKIRQLWKDRKWKKNE